MKAGQFNLPALVLRDTDLNEVVSIIGQASIFWIVVAALVNLGHNIFRPGGIPPLVVDDLKWRDCLPQCP